ncbi:MAG: MBOAT family O-acyltransferase, partial [Clostridium sp.]
LFSIGLFKKVILADTISLIASNGFDLSKELAFLEGWITSLSYTLQIYFDFSGYSLMALGIAALFNIKLPQNFNYPYRATSIKDFWQRWHITLGSFFTKYVYFPLGGNRKGEGRTYLNLFIIFFISGLWHGTGINFLIWGVMHGIARCINQFFINKKIKVNKVLAWFLTFNFVNIAWVFFRASDLNTAFKVLHSMFDFSTLQASLLILNENSKFLKLILVILITAFILSITYKIKNKKARIAINLIIFSICFINLCVLYSFTPYFFKDLFINFEYSLDFIKAIKLFIIGGVLVLVNFENIISIEKFKPNLITLSLSSILIFLSLIDLNKVSDFIYKSF